MPEVATPFPTDMTALPAFAPPAAAKPTSTPFPGDTAKLPDYVAPKPAKPLENLDFKPWEKEVGALKDVGQTFIKGAKNAAALAMQHPGVAGQGLSPAAAQETQAALDVMLSGAGFMISTFGDAFARLAAVSEKPSDADYERGASRAVKGALEEKSAEGLALIHKALGLGETKGAIADLMKRANDFIESGAEPTANATGGVIGPDDYKSLVDGLFGYLTARAMRPSKPLIEKVVNQAEADAMRANAQHQPPGQASRVYEKSTEEAARASQAQNGDLKWNEADGVWEPADTPAKTQKLLPGPKTPKDSAVEKVSKGKATEMSGEERQAYLEWKEEGGPKDGKPREPTADESTWEGEGGRYLAAAGLGTALAAGAYFASPEQRKLAVEATAGGLILFKGRAKGEPGFSLTEIAKLSEDIPISGLLERSDTTTKTLERLGEKYPGNTSFTKKQVEQEIGKAGATKEEAEIMRRALEKTPGERITAKDLVMNVKSLTGDFELEAKHVKTWASEGMENIGLDKDALWDRPGSYPVTTLYKSPPSANLPKNNHFPDEPNVFGWSRSFIDEQGVQHVVELQTELEKGQSLTPEKRAELEREKAEIDARLPSGRIAGLGPELRRALVDYDSRLNAQQKSDLGYILGPRNYPRGVEPPIPREIWETRPPAPEVVYDIVYKDAMENRNHNSMVALREAVLQHSSNDFVRSAEIKHKLADAGDISKVLPVIETGFAKRLIREELARATRPSDPVEVARLREAARNPPSRGAQRIADATWGGNLALREQSRVPAESVRFASAETVAKVEGWSPKEELDKWESEQGFPPEPGPRWGKNQRIFDRYVSLDKYYKSLGGKPYTDPAGNTWWEVPTPKHGRVSQLGGGTPEALRAIARLAAMGYGGYWVYQHSDPHSALRAVMAALSIGFVARLRPVQMALFAKQILKAARASNREVDIIVAARERQASQRLANIDALIVVDKVDKLVPKGPRQEAVATALSKGKAAVDALPTKEKEAANLLRDQLEARLFEAVDADVLHTAHDQFMRAMWDVPGNDPMITKAFFDRRGVGGPPSAPRNLAGHVEEGERLGLKPLSKEAGNIYLTFAQAMIGATTNKAFMGSLRGTVVPSMGLPAMMASGKAPINYEHLNHPLFTGYRFYPDVVGPMKVLFDTNPPGVAFQRASEVSDVAKRFKVSLSVFHTKTLVEAAMRASSHPLSVLVQVPSILLGTHMILQELKQGSASPLVVRAVDAGVMFTTKGAGSEDAGVGFYPAMKSVAVEFDKMVPGMGVLPKGLSAVTQKVDTLMWERLHPVLKIILFQEKSRQLMVNSAAEARAGRGRALTQGEADRIAADHANKVEGGLNYQQIALEAKTAFGRALAEAAYTQSSRRGLQMMFFAPDWNLSAISLLLDAIGDQPGAPNVGTLKGVLPNVRPGWGAKDKADLARQMILRSALYYFIAFNALNYLFAGQPIYKNKDPTKIQMGPPGSKDEGVYMQIDKSMFETVNMAMKGGQEFFNKLGAIPSAVLETATGTEYIHPHQDKRTGQIIFGPEREDSLPEHEIRRLLPFALTADERNILEGHPIEQALAVSGIIQFSGSTPDSREREKERAKKRREQRLREKEDEEYKKRTSR